MAWIVKGSGTAEFRGEHSCRVEFQTENTATGEIRRERKTFQIKAKTKKEKERCKREFRAELETGLDRDERTTTFGEYAERWQKQRIANPEVEDATNKLDDWCIRTINLTFEKYRLCAMTRMDVKAFQTGLITADENGEAKTLSGNPLCGTSANKVRKTLRQILQEAVRDGIIAKNPCDDLKGPSKDTVEKEPLTAQQTAQFRAVFDANEPTPKLVAYRLALFAGLRRGEICALKWSDFDAEAGTITVSKSINEVKRKFKSTKTEAGERTIPLDAGTIDYLKRFKAESIFKLLSMGKPVEDTCITAPFQKDRDFMYPAYVTHSLEKFTKKNNLPRVTPHQLRHTYCTLLFAAGTDLKTVQYLMGHDDPATTLGIYTHYVESNGVKAASAIEKMMASIPTSPRIVSIPNPANPRRTHAHRDRPTPKAIAI